VNLSAYVAVTALLVATPGVATAVVVRNALRGGRGAGLRTAAGVATANAGYGLLAALGLAAFLGQRPEWVLGVKRVGAVYLAFLGGQAIWKSLDRRLAATATESNSAGTDWAQGFATNALNPSVAVFYATLVPQFVPAGDEFLRGFAILSAIHVVMAFGLHSLYAVSLGRLAQTTTRPGVRRGLLAITGVALVALALRLLLTG
jgi:threonine/homoserine/homoserine lactone efflux protein